MGKANKSTSRKVVKGKVNKAKHVLQREIKKQQSEESSKTKLQLIAIFQYLKKGDASFTKTLTSFEADLAEKFGKKVLKSGEGENLQLSFSPAEDLKSTSDKSSSSDDSEDNKEMNDSDSDYSSSDDESDHETTNASK